MTKPKVYGQKETNPERLRLLEAVAEMAEAHIRNLYVGERTFAAYIRKYGDWMGRHHHHDRGAAVLKALAALEALDEKEQP